MSKKFIAVDLGASSGRVIAGILENGKLSLEEIHRFENGKNGFDRFPAGGFVRRIVDAVAFVEFREETGDAAVVPSRIKAGI